MDENRNIVIILLIWAEELSVAWVSLFKYLIKEEHILHLGCTELWKASI